VHENGGVIGIFESDKQARGPDRRRSEDPASLPAVLPQGGVRRTAPHAPA